MRSTILFSGFVILGSAIAINACGGDDGPTGTAGGAGYAGAWQSDSSTVQVGNGVQVTDNAGTFTCYPTTCANKLLQCGNCRDDDGDGLVDWRDPECLGPCDNTEGPGLDSDVGGTTGTSCGVDCYFDFGNGAGNDNCLWDHRCDPLDPEVPTCPYTQSMVGSKDCPATQPAACASYCLPYTPNGCDCFGCCTFPQLAGRDGGKDRYVWIGAMDADNVSTCTFADILDPAKCPPCTPVENCLNGCGVCELCIGKTTVPPECNASTPDSGVPSQCDPGITPCGLPGQAPCGAGYYCISGCCQVVLR